PLQGPPLCGPPLRGLPLRRPPAPHISTNQTRHATEDNMDVTDSRSRIRPAIAPILILGLLAIFLFPRQSASQAQETISPLTEVSLQEAEDTGVAHAVGLAFSFLTETFHLQAGHQVAGLELVQ